VSPNSNVGVSLGAYLLQTLVLHCENCGASESPQWRRGWYSTVLQKHVLLCNGCGIKYSKQQFCSYCYYVYNKRTERLQRSLNQWLCCGTCQRWVHRACEEKYGLTTTQIGALPCSPDLPTWYTCPNCQLTSQPNQPAATASDHA
jgi:GATA zinc finger